jgi:hypothetical protein
MSAFDLDKLEQLARAATPGPWLALFGDEYIYGVAIRSEEGDSVAEWDDLPLSEQDARFIAVANPAAVLELVREVRMLRKLKEIDAEIIRDRDTALRAAEAIVRDLARHDPCTWPLQGCPLRCNGHILFNPPDKSRKGIFEHGESCPYRRAVEASNP